MKERTICENDARGATAGRLGIPQIQATVVIAWIDQGLEALGVQSPGCVVGP